MARFVRGAFWSLLGSGVAYACSLGAAIITARWLGKQGFGEFSMILSTVGMLGTFAGMGLGMTSTKYVAELRRSAPARVARILRLTSGGSLVSGTVIALIICIGANQMAAGMLRAPHLAFGLKLGAALLFFNTVNGNQSGILMGFEAFKTLAILNLTRGILTLPTTIVGVLYYGLPGAIVASVLVAGMLCLAMTVLIRGERIRFKIGAPDADIFQEIKILWSFSLPALLTGALAVPVTWAANAVLVSAASYSELGLFNAANQWRVAITFLPAAASQPLLALLANSFGERSLRNSKRILLVGVALNFGLSTVCAAVIIAFSRTIMGAYGTTFRSGSVLLDLLMLSAVISCTAGAIGQVLAGLGDMWWGLGLNFVWALVLLGVFSTWLSTYGAQGLAVSFLISYSVHAVTVTTYLLWRLRGLDRRIKASEAANLHTSAPLSDGARPANG